MPRIARKRGDSAIYHIVVQSATNKQIFRTRDAKEFYLERLLKYESDFHLDLYAYCLLDSHVHILVGEGDIDISDLMRRMNVSFASWYHNHADISESEKKGRIFRGRYLSEPLERALLPGTIRYIELEPWRNGLVREGEDYPFVSRGLKYSREDRLTMLKREEKEMEMAVSEAAADYAVSFSHLDEAVYKYGKTYAEGYRAIMSRLDFDDPYATKFLPRDEQIKLIRAFRYEDHLSINLICRVTGLGRGLVMRVKKTS